MWPTVGLKSIRLATGSIGHCGCSCALLLSVFCWLWALQCPDGGIASCVLYMFEGALTALLVFLIADAERFWCVVRQFLFVPGHCGHFLGHCSTRVVCNLSLGGKRDDHDVDAGGI